MTEITFAAYVDAICPAFMKHSKKEDAAMFLLESVSGQEPIVSQASKKKDIRKDGTLSRILRGVERVPENIRLAAANSEVVKNVVSYFRSEVLQDINPHLKEDLQASFIALIENDTTISAAKKENLKLLYEGDDLALFLANLFLYAINRFNKSQVEGVHQKISIPLLVFTFFYAISIFIVTMLTIIKIKEVSQPLMAFAFFFSIGLFVFLIGFYFFLWRRDI